MDIVAGCSPAPMRVGGRGRPCVGVRRGEPQGRASAHAACREPACAARGVSTAKADAKSAACRHGGRRRLRHAGAQTSQWSSWPRVASRATAILRLGGSREAAAVHRWGQQAEAADHKSIAQERRATMHRLTCGQPMVQRRRDSDSAALAVLPAVLARQHRRRLVPLRLTRAETEAAPQEPDALRLR